MLRYLDVQNILDKNDLILQESGCVGSENERGNTYMKKIGIVTDSHSSISQEEAEKLGIFVLPMPFYIDGECFYESVTLSRELFFEKLAAGADITTSQPSPTAVMEIWDKALEQFEKILYLPISSGLSGSYETAMMLAKDEAYEGRVLVVDDGQVAAPLHQMVLDTLDMIKKGYEAEQIRDLLERAGDRMMIYIALQTLECLKKGGRVTPAAAALGSVFNIKPILKLQTGKLDSFKKCHGIVKAKKAAIEAMQAEIRDNFQDALMTAPFIFWRPPAERTRRMRHGSRRSGRHFRAFRFSMIICPSAYPAISDRAEWESDARWHRIIRECNAGDMVLLQNVRRVEDDCGIR